MPDAKAKIGRILERMRGKTGGDEVHSMEGEQHPKHEQLHPHMHDFIEAVHAHDHHAATEHMCRFLDVHGAPEEDAEEADKY